MHYEDLILKEIKCGEDCWYGSFISKRGGMFYFPIASLDVSEEELKENGIVVGKTFLGAVDNTYGLVGLNNFSFIKKSKTR